MKFKRYNADDEEPKCIQCDHMCDDFKCEKFCGPEHGWYGYIRTERTEQKETVK